MKIQPATGSFARNLIYSTKPAGAFKSDMILTQKTFADILTADASEEEIKRVVVLNKLTDKEEIETKIVAFLKERHLKVADYE
nr:PTS lactose transporter subunit IIB [Klebsiella pneumoniae]